MSSDPTYLSAEPHQPPQINRYVPQSPRPASPPLTPSPSSPVTKGSSSSNPAIPPQSLSPAPGPADTAMSSGAAISPSGTPDNYAYANNNPPIRPGISRSNSSSSSVAGMGINFPPQNNPLPAELVSPHREISPLPDVQDPGLGASASASFNAHSSSGAGSGSGFGVPMQKARSSDSVTSPNNGSSSMAQSFSAGPTPAFTSASVSASASGPAAPPPPPQNIYASLHPSSSAQFAPVRPRTVSPRANTPTTFASSSSVSQNPTSLEARGRVVSPNNKMEGMGISSPIDFPHGMNGALDEKSSSGASSNPYDPPSSSSSSSSMYQYNSYASAHHQPFYPLTGAGAGMGKEAQYGSTPTIQPANVPFQDSVAYWLGLYFCFNLGLTLFNKFVLVSFPFPYTLTGLHALSGCAGTYLALEKGAFVPARLTQKENMILAAFSVLYTINIAVSNISLQLVTVPFHQVVRASTPLFTILVSSIVLRTKFSAMKLVSLLPVVAGVGFATYGDYYFTAWGLILTLLGTFLAALKTIVTNLIQTGGGGRLKLHPLDLLMRMSPLAFIQCVIYGWYTGELDRVRRYGATQMTRGKAFALLINGIIACGLNIVSFTANKKAGALTMTVSANCKQVLTIALAVVLFNLHISPTNGLGILLTLIGGGWYGYVEYIEKKKRTVKLVERA